MAATFDKDMNIITNFLKDMDIIAALDDQPNDVGGLTAAELKAKFDEGGKAIQEYINGTLIPEVLGLDSTEASRKQAEEARAAAETLRQQAETARASAEANRAAAETGRVRAEEGRVQAENSRAAAETARAQAEQQRADETSGIVARATAQANAAAGSASAASASAGTAAEQASAASGSAAAAAQNAQQAAASQSAAAQSAQNAAASQTLAQSWAVGGTGQRAGEDTDNARYWSQMAQNAAGGGVTAFHGRTGVVEPAEGDYTAEMVGAIPAAEKGAAGGVATLGADGLVTDAQLPYRYSLRTCRLVVGTSTAGWTEEQCDYLCDGTADDVEIQAAVDALPEGGGTVVLLDGTYNLTNYITISKDYVTVRGDGMAVSVLADYDTSAPIFWLNGDYGTVSHMQLATAPADNTYKGGVQIRGEHCTVESVIVGKSNGGVSIQTSGAWATVRNCTMPGGFTSQASYTVVTGNNFTYLPDFKSLVVYLIGNCYKFSGNYISGYTLSVGGSYGTISDNYIQGPENDTAIDLYGDQLICRGNICFFGNQSAEYTGKTIDVRGNNCIVAHNITRLKEVSESGGSNNLIVDNKVIV